MECTHLSSKPASMECHRCCLRVCWSLHLCSAATGSSQHGPPWQQTNRINTYRSHIRHAQLETPPCFDWPKYKTKRCLWETQQQRTTCLCPIISQFHNHLEVKYSGRPLDNQTWQSEWTTVLLPKVQLKSKLWKLLLWPDNLYARFDCPEISHFYPLHMIVKVAYSNTWKAVH